MVALDGHITVRRLNVVYIVRTLPLQEHVGLLVVMILDLASCFAPAVL
jgi:hypothetical protein